MIRNKYLSIYSYGTKTGVQKCHFNFTLDKMNKFIHVYMNVKCPECGMYQVNEISDVNQSKAFKQIDKKVF